MTDGFIRLPPDDTGKAADTEELLVNGLLVQRERDQICGATDIEITRVVNTDALSTDHGIVVRPAPPVAPQLDYVTSSNLAQGASVDLDGSTISAATTGKLMKVTVSSSIPCKWQIKTRDGAVEVIIAVLFTGGIVERPTDSWQPTSKEMATLAGAGVDENFRVTATSLSGAAVSADVHATLEWDEV